MAAGLIETVGMISKAIPVGEFDKRAELLTMDRGKLSFFARGARRMGNAFTGITMPFCYGKFTLYEGRGSYSLHSASISNYFEEIYADMEKTCYGTYFLEMASYYAREYSRDPDILKLVYVSLLALSRESIPHELVRRIFELRLMSSQGECSHEPQEPYGRCAYTWNFIRSASYDKLYSFTVTDEIYVALSGAVDKLLAENIDRPIHSLEVLRSMMTI